MAIIPAYKTFDFKKQTVQPQTRPDWRPLTYSKVMQEAIARAHELHALPGLADRLDAEKKAHGAS